MTRPFLTARWTNVVLANYRVPPTLLEPYVPPGSELDTPDGSPDLHLLSLVALNFDDLRVYGIPVPTAQHFSELNLRFYVRRGPLRAAVFLREFVSPLLVVLGARLCYFQPYHRAHVSHHVRARGLCIDVRTSFRYRRHRGEIRLRARNHPATPPTDSEEHFLKEHYWGFDCTPWSTAFRYRVDHPVWRVFPIEHAVITIDPGVLLGGRWQTLDWDAALHSVLFAEGSRATVYEAEPLIAPLPHWTRAGRGSPAGVVAGSNVEKS